MSDCLLTHQRHRNSGVYRNTYSNVGKCMGWLKVNLLKDWVLCNQIRRKMVMTSSWR